MTRPTEEDLTNALLIVATAGSLEAGKPLSEFIGHVISQVQQGEGPLAPKERVLGTLRWLKGQAEKREREEANAS